MEASFCGSRRIRTSEPQSVTNTLAGCRFQPLSHASFILGDRWDSNPRPPEPQSGTLPSELRTPYHWWNLAESNHIIWIFSPAHTPSLPKFQVAEAEGFEPTGPFGPTVFKTAALDHSAMLPIFDCKGTMVKCSLFAQPKII